LTFRSSIVPRVGTTTLLVSAVLWSAAVDICARDSSGGWTVLKNCRLIPNPANDGDSFHVSAGDKEYLFRLYFIDAPETDSLAPGRLVEQAKYFGVTVPQAIETGRAAKEFTQQKLSEPFTVFTHMADAMGQSRIERFYAFVQTKDGDLGELLVRNGLARNHGFKAAPPGTKSSRIELEKLHQLEDQARQQKIGVWAVSGTSVNEDTKLSGSRLSDADSTAAFSESANQAWSIAPGTPTPQLKLHAKAKPPLGRIDVNTATEKELTTVPGVGHVMAARIIAARPFRTADDLKKVSGIGNKKYAQIRPYFQ
jgi:DNA uptake protein ComE-like DNA-binding protein